MNTLRRRLFGFLPALPFAGVAAAAAAEPRTWKFPLGPQPPPPLPAQFVDMPTLTFNHGTTPVGFVSVTRDGLFFIGADGKVTKVA